MKLQNIPQINEENPKDVNFETGWTWKRKDLRPVSNLKFSPNTGLNAQDSDRRDFWA